MKCPTAATHTQIIAITDINVPYFHDCKINSKGSKLLGFAVTSPHTVYLEHLHPLSYPFLTLFPHFSHSTPSFYLWPFNPSSPATLHTRGNLWPLALGGQITSLNTILSSASHFCLLMGTSANFITFLLWMHDERVLHTSLKWAAFDYFWEVGFIPSSTGYDTLDHMTLNF